LIKKKEPSPRKTESKPTLNESTSPRKASDTTSPRKTETKESKRADKTKSKSTKKNDKNHEDKSEKIAKELSPRKVSDATTQKTEIKEVTTTSDTKVIDSNNEQKVNKEPSPRETKPTETELKVIEIKDNINSTSEKVADITTENQVPKDSPKESTNIKTDPIIEVKENNSTKETPDIKLPLLSPKSNDTDAVLSLFYKNTESLTDEKIEDCKTSLPEQPNTKPETKPEPNTSEPKIDEVKLQKPQEKGRIIKSKTYQSFTLRETKNEKEKYQTEISNGTNDDINLGTVKKKILKFNKLRSNRQLPSLDPSLEDQSKKQPKDTDESQAKEESYVLIPVVDPTQIIDPNDDLEDKKDVRTQVIKELIITERTYVQDLTIMKVNFLSIFDKNFFFIGFYRRFRTKRNLGQI